jgi:hypothetical protein
VTIPRDRFLVYLVYCAGLAVALPFALAGVPAPEAELPMILAFGIGAVVPVVYALFPRVNLLEPVYWFAAMYYWFFIGPVYLILSDFRFSAHLIVTGSEKWELMTTSLSLALGGYLSLLGGYLIVRRSRQPNDIVYQSEAELPSWLLRAVTALFVLIGTLSFIQYAGAYPGGIVDYLRDFGLRAHRYEQMQEESSTIGYHFLYAAVFIWIFTLRRAGPGRLGRLEYLLFWPTLGVSILALVGEARIFQLVSYLLVIPATFYLTAQRRERREFTFLVLGGSMILSGILLYVARLASILLYNRPDAFAGQSLADIGLAALEGMAFLLIDKGNVPNVVVLMTIVDRWEADFGLQYGKTLLNWLAAFVPDMDSVQMGPLIGDRWYQTVGGLPPTIIGELYANFRTGGVLFGMFAVGMLMAFTFNLARRCRDYWIYLAYVAIVCRFFFGWPKGETMNLVGAIKLFLPTLVTMVALRFVVNIFSAAVASRDRRLWGIKNGPRAEGVAGEVHLTTQP